jgi:hypothetical protein
MHLDRYLFSVSLKTETLTEYEFISIGPKGYIKKLIRFTKVGFNCYNLAFGKISLKTVHTMLSWEQENNISFLTIKNNPL